MFFISIVLLLLAFTLTVTSFLQQKDILTAEFKKRGLSISKSLASSSLLSVYLDNREDLNRLVDKMGREKDVAYVSIVDAGGSILAQNKDLGFVPPEITKRALEADRITIITFQIGKEELCEFIVPIITREHEGVATSEFLDSSEVARGRPDFKKIGMVRLGMSFESINLYARRLVRKNALLMFLIVAICLLFTHSFLSRMITGPIKGLTAVALSAADEGDLTQEAPEVRSKDEVGILLSVFNKMIHNLSKIIREVRKSTDQVHNFARNTSESAQQMSLSTQEISTAVQQINQGATTQVKKIEQANKVVQKMVDSTMQITINANQATKASVETKELSQEGMKSSFGAKEKVDRIVEATNNISGLVGKLGERSQEIGRIIETITKIAEQTNLLSLNAAIEAARAGEAGRGFAVVAGEVRKLAENSARASIQIINLIRNTQQETNEAVKSVRNAQQEVGEGKVVIEQVRAALNKIFAASQETTRQVEEIAKSTESQLANTQEVTQAFEDINAIAEQNASSVQEVTSSVEEVTASIEELSTFAQELFKSVSVLEEFVRRFKVETS